MSSWDKTVEKSSYHFDNHGYDPRYDTVISLGKIIAPWEPIAKAAIEKSKPATWATRGYKKRDAEIPSQDLIEEEYDLERAGVDKDIIITNLCWELDSTLERVSKLFALADPMNRIHVQYPGQVWNLHIDKLQKWCPEDPNKVIRIMIQLTDWQQGQFWNYGNYLHSGWRAGDVTTFDWQNVPHSTANAGHHPRVTLQMTGVVTQETKDFLRYLGSVAEFVLR